ncbi:hypothetical protein K438DRAFT_915815 [Mycena galopus ATCC 62051]|nr:hypothetical protein K438DRAFT_915815 [Mycena galopus ATCC 62051]
MPARASNANADAAASPLRTLTSRFACPPPCPLRFRVPALQMPLRTSTPPSQCPSSTPARFECMPALAPPGVARPPRIPNARPIAHPGPHPVAPLAHPHSPPVPTLAAPMLAARTYARRPHPRSSPTPAARNLVAHASPSCTHPRRTRCVLPFPTHARSSHLARTPRVPTPAARNLLAHANPLRTPTPVPARPSNPSPIPVARTFTPCSPARHHTRQLHDMRPHPLHLLFLIASRRERAVSSAIKACARPR